MTLSANDRIAGPYAGDGSTTTFTYDFPVAASSALKVKKRDAGGAVSTLVLGADYSLTGVGDATGGTWVMTTAPTTSETVWAEGATALSQTFDPETGQPLNAKALEAAFDTVMQILQEHAAQLVRAVVLEMADSPSGGSWRLPPLDTLKGQLIGVDSAGALTGLAFTAGSTVVNSVFGRTGAVLAAASDYDAVQIDFNAAGLSHTSASDVQVALADLDSAIDGKADSGAFQPLDADLTAIAGLTTTAAGRSLLTMADPGADRLIGWDESAGVATPLALADIAPVGALQLQSGDLLLKQDGGRLILGQGPAAEDMILLYSAGGELKKAPWSALDEPPGLAETINVTPTGAATQLRVVEQEISGLSGATVDSGIVIPDRAIVFAVSTRTTQTITGATSYDCGIAGETNKFGGSLDINAGGTNSGVIGPTAFYADTPVRLTANGGDFTGGAVRVVIHYMLCDVPTS